jgi:hypothetical protein
MLRRPSSRRSRIFAFRRKGRRFCHRFGYRRVFNRFGLRRVLNCFRHGRAVDRSRHRRLINHFRCLYWQVYRCCFRCFRLLLPGSRYCFNWRQHRITYWRDRLGDKLIIGLVEHEADQSRHGDAAEKKRHLAGVF